jgi:outer membrane protein assembly factor BamB
MKYTSDGQDAWPAPTLIAGTMAGGINSGSAVAILPDGDIAATGFVTNNATNRDIFVGRFDSASGAPRWQLTFNGTPAGGNDTGTAITAAPDGDIVVAGNALLSPFSLASSFTVLRFDGSGSLRWAQSVEAGFFNVVRTVAIAPNGDVIAGGRLQIISGPDNSMLFVLAIEQNGNERWRYAAAGASRSLEANGIAFDIDGNPIVTGIAPNPAAITAFELLAFEKTTGGVLWKAPILGSLPLVHGGSAVVGVPGTNAVIAVGTIQNERTSSDITIARVTGGHEDWRALITGPGKRIDRDDNVLAMAVSSQQDAIALAGVSEKTCCTVEGDVREFRVAKVRKNGKTAWKFDFADPAPYQDNAALAVAFGADGEIYAAGRTCALGTTSCFTVVRLTKQGDEVWRAVIPGAAGRRGEARALVVDDADHAVIAAGVEPIAAGNLLAVYKLDADTGAIRWSYLSDVFGAANAMTMTARGTVAIAAQLFGRFAVLELDRQTGVSTSLVDLGGGEGQSIVYDTSRDQLVAGGIHFAGGGLSFSAAAKLDRDGTPLWSFDAQRANNGASTAAVAINPSDGAVGLVGWGFDAQSHRVMFDAMLLSASGQSLFTTTGRGAARAVDFAGANMIVAAQLDADQQFGPFNSAFAVLAFAQDGTEVWRRTAHGNVVGTNSASSLAIDNIRGTVFAAGAVTNSATRSDMFAVGLTFNGGDLPGFQSSSPE